MTYYLLQISREGPSTGTIGTQHNTSFHKCGEEAVADSHLRGQSQELLCNSGYTIASGCRARHTGNWAGETSSEAVLFIEYGT